MPAESELRLYRDSLSTPWGFRLHGGKDVNAPLTVQKVLTGSPSDGELQSGDVILQIQGTEASRFTHLQAQDQIRNAGGSLLLRIVRYAAPILRAPLLLTPTHASQQRVTQWKKPGANDYGVDYSRQPGRIPAPLVAAQPLPQPGFMLSRVKDTLSGVSGGLGGYPLYQTYESDIRHSPSLYQPPSYVTPTARAPEEPAWAGSLRSSGQSLDSDKYIGPQPHNPKVQSVHYGPGGTQEYRQHAPAENFDSETVRAAHLQYNSPLGLYSKASAQEAMHSQLHGKPGEGTIKILSESEANRADGETGSQARGSYAGGETADIGQSDF